MSGSRIINLRLDGPLLDELEAFAKARGVVRSEAMRELIAEALLARNESTYAKVCRSAVREELDRWLLEARIQKEWAADDFYDRLSAALATEVSDIRAVAGAALYAAVLACGGDPEEVYGRAVEAGPWMGFAPTMEDAESMGEEG